MAPTDNAVSSGPKAPSRVPGGQKACLGFLVATVVGVSLVNGILALRATYYYAAAGFPWFEWANYLFLALFLLACPPLALCFLDSVHVRRGLRLFLFGMALSKVLEVFEGPVNHLGALWTYERPLNALYLLVEFVALVVCWLFLLRQVRGFSLLPVPVRTDRRGAGALFRNLKHFLRRRGPALHLRGYSQHSPRSQHPSRAQRTPRSSRTRRGRLLTVVLAVNVACLAGVFVTLLPENHVVRLARPADHDMQVKFWANRPSRHNNGTLALLAEHDVEVYCWMDMEDVLSWASYNISCYKVKGVPDGSDPTELAEFYEYVDAWMDYADARPETRQYFRGFMADDEGLKTIARFNTTSYELEIETKRAAIAHINARGYEYGMTTVLANIGDLYDGDRDVDVVYHNPFDPVAYANMSQWNWMVYRSETAMQYDEPHAYFTYQWASHVRDYMRFVEDAHALPRGTWLNRTGISIGVTSDKMYTYNVDLRPVEAALDEIILDAQICHACELADATVFYLPHFSEIFGEEGLRRFLEEVEAYQVVEIPYKRRATYFGNLKWASNVNGSVFGLFFCDGLYDAGFAALAMAWMVALAAVPVLFVAVGERWSIVGPPIPGKAGAAALTSSSPLGKPVTKTTIPPPGEAVPDESPPLDGGSDDAPLVAGLAGQKVSLALRWAFLLLVGLILVWTFLVAEIFVFSKEIVYWGPWYWQEIALDEEWFVAFWADFTGLYVYVLGAVLGVIVVLGVLLRRWLDRRLARDKA